ncbi:glycosyltransferase [Chitinophaga sp. Hz27]|uniref:glycosyltransferase n=1 Tax=Chitinophaga sp. Hz27 TaxID=3347169 RepID=UPI0035E16FF4
MSIPTYIINLPSRTDRKEHILKEFADRNEFEINIIAPCPHEVGAVSLWYTIRHILKDLTSVMDNFVIICEDDHQFTVDYTHQALNDAIEEAQRLDADILLGGISWFENAVQVNDKLFWVQLFSGTQFMVIFKKFYQTIIDAEFDETDNADFKICALTASHFTTFPFISTQRDFGYSDVTTKNNEKGRIDTIFNNTMTNFSILNEVGIFYEKKAIYFETLDQENIDNITIPTYVICASQNNGKHAAIEKQFEGRSEFDVKIIPTIPHERKNISHWKDICNIIEIAIDNEDDVIILCQEDHLFSPHYSKQVFLDQIIAAHQQGAEILAGGVDGFGRCVPLTANRFWINSFFGSQFLVLYSSIFEKILAEPFYGTLTADAVLSEISSNKMVIYPFISLQKKWTTINDQGSVPLLYPLTILEINQLVYLTYSKGKHAANQLMKLTQKTGSLITPISPVPEVSFFENTFFKSIIHPTNKITESKIRVLIPYHNVKDYITECVDSLLKQKYCNFTLSFLDDCSDDDTMSLIPENVPGIFKQSLQERTYALGNIYQCLTQSQFQDEDIIMILDGDDFLLHDQVFNIINEIYAVHNCLISFGQYYSTTQKIGHCQFYTKEEFAKLRSLRFRASHLKAFRYKLFKEFQRQDPEANSYKNDSGQFYNMSYDVALMTPLLEIAGFENIYFNSNPVYGYRLHEKNDAHINMAMQSAQEIDILNKPPFKRIF